MVRQTGRWPADIPVEPPFPEELTYVWKWFADLASGRGGSGLGVSPLAWSEIRAWSLLTGHEPNAWEIGLLRRLDMSYLSSVAETEKAEKKK